MTHLVTQLPLDAPVDATTLTPAAVARIAYFAACEQVCKAMRIRDEAWAAYEQARAEQPARLPQE